MCIQVLCAKFIICSRNWLNGTHGQIKLCITSMSSNLWKSFLYAAQWTFSRQGQGASHMYVCHVHIKSLMSSNLATTWHWSLSKKDNNNNKWRSKTSSNGYVSMQSLSEHSCLCGEHCGQLGHLLLSYLITANGADRANAGGDSITDWIYCVLADSVCNRKKWRQQMDTAGREGREWVWKKLRDEIEG